MQALRQVTRPASLSSHRLIISLMYLLLEYSEAHYAIFSFLGVNREELTGAGENCIMRSFRICARRQIGLLLG
jgi:hypothetical protein